MTKRIMTNKLIQYGIIGFLAFAIIVIIVAKIRR